MFINTSLRTTAKKKKSTVICHCFVYGGVRVGAERAAASMTDPAQH